MPNPANKETVTLQYSLPASGAVSIVLISAVGKSETVFQGEVHAGEHTFFLNTNALTSGSYHVHIRTEHEQKTIPLIIIR
jgi:hypothetical protein